MQDDPFQRAETVAGVGFEERLQALRVEIDAVDEKLVELLLRRRDVVDRVAELKRAHGVPLYHPAREEDLISRRREQARHAGMDPDAVEDLFRMILRNSRASQAAALSAQRVRARAKVLVVGGRGGMGQSIVRWFGSAGYEVRVLDREDWFAAGDLCDGVDLAILSVPIAITETVAVQIAPHLPKHAILADITSVKVGPMSAMLAAHPGPVVGLHPMFGPDAATLDKQIVVVTPGRGEEAWRWLPEQLAAWGAVIVRATAEEHDETMSVVQALRHFATFAFGQFLYRRRVDLARTLEFSSPIYRLELGMVGRLFAQDPALYAEIVFATPARREMLKEYLASAARNREMLDRDDRTAFEKEFGRIAEWFGPFCEQALRESGYLIEKMIDRF